MSAKMLFVLGGSKPPEYSCPPPHPNNSQGCLVYHRESIDRTYVHMISKASRPSLPNRQGITGDTSMIRSARLPTHDQQGCLVYPKAQFTGDQQGDQQGCLRINLTGVQQQYTWARLPSLPGCNQLVYYDPETPT